MISINKSNKDMLAKLMATENITVLHKKVPTAYFDVKNRTLVVPIFKEEMSPELKDLFSGHEVGHALFTPLEGWHDAVCESGPIFKGYLNVIEDCRIEREIKNKYPGLRRSFYTGYLELAKMNFFGVNDKDKKKLNLIDRINLYYKIGTRSGIEFSKEEQVYLDMINKLETFDDVIEVAKLLFEKQKNITEENLESLSQESLLDLLEELGLDEDEEDFDGHGTSTKDVEASESDEEFDGHGTSTKDAEEELQPGDIKIKDFTDPSNEEETF